MIWASAAYTENMTGATGMAYHASNKDSWSFTVATNGDLSASGNNNQYGQTEILKMTNGSTLSAGYSLVTGLLQY